jgi:cytochrome P450
MKNPRAYERLVEEIDKAYADGNLSSPYITYAEAMKLPYLVACCKEAMRMHPSVGLGLPRHVPEGGKQICGQFFPAGSRVSINAAVVHFDEEIFGSDAAWFNPDRWLGDSAANMDRHMLHFGGGSRTCIGKNVWLLLSHYLLVSNLLHRSPSRKCTNLYRSCCDRIELNWQNPAKSGKRKIFGLTSRQESASW